MVVVVSAVFIPSMFVAVTVTALFPIGIVRMSKVQVKPVTVAADSRPLTATATVTSSLSAVPSMTMPVIVWKDTTVGETTGFMVIVTVGADAGAPPVAGRWISCVPFGMKSSG